MKFKMAATAGLSLTLDPMGKMFQKKYMRTEQEDKSHPFDVWHVAKGKNTCRISVL
jgi:hypothetical protein